MLVLVPLKLVPTLAWCR